MYIYRERERERLLSVVGDIGEKSEDERVRMGKREKEHERGRKRREGAR